MNQPSPLDNTRPRQCIDKGTLWAVHTVKHLPSYYHGRVALIGDAAHAMMPFQGSGAGQGVEVSVRVGFQGTGD